MKKQISCFLILVVMVGLMGCQQLPDFSAGRLSNPFATEMIAGSDPFLSDDVQNDFEADLSTPHTGAAPRTFAKPDSLLAAKDHAKPKGNTGRAHISSYTPPVPQSNVQLDRPAAPFQQIGYQASPRSYQPEQNRFTKMMSKEATIAHPFASSSVHTASYEVPVNKTVLSKQAETMGNPFAAESMKQAHVPQKKLVHVPGNPFQQIDNKEEKPNKVDRWRRSGSTPSQPIKNDNYNRTQFMQPTQ